MQKNDLLTCSAAERQSGRFTESPADVLDLGDFEPNTADSHELLRQSERKRQALLTTISELLFVVSRSGTILEFHCPPDSDYLLSAEGLVGKSIKELLPRQVGLQAMHYLEKTLRTGAVQTASYQFQMRNGVRHFETRLAVFDQDQVVGLVRDVTDRTFLEKELLEISHREQLRIGQDLHDGLGQHLTGITFLAKALERKLLEQGRTEAVAAGEINRLVMQALSQTRSLARGLVPVELESRGLVCAISELTERVHQTCDIDCSLECADTLKVNNRTVALHLFRLTQEAISNSVRHGKAKNILIQLTKTANEGQLTIQDDGKGFSVDGQPRKGLGLRIMTYRAHKAGGSLEILQSPNGGVTIACCFRDNDQPA